MKIYTKTGDDGTTSLLGGKRVSKADLRIETYGTVDELNAYIGLLRDQQVNQHRITDLLAIQDKLFTIGARLSADDGSKTLKLPELGDDDVHFLEQAIDTLEQTLPTMRNFILPGGHQSVSFCHVARTVCRRAERLAIALRQVSSVGPVIVHYLNRLSDYLFVLSRKMAQELHAEEMPWTPRNRP
jgi:cob(I)alamin adenosyltransferase